MLSVRPDCNCYDDRSDLSSKVLELNQLTWGPSKVDQRRGKNRLTARASWLLLSGTEVGLCFLGWGAGSSGPLLLSPPASSPQILASLEGMFSLLVSACSGVILFLDRQLGRKRKPSSTTLPLHFISLTLDEILLQTNQKAPRSSFHLSHLYFLWQLMSCLVSLLILFSSYLLSTLLLTWSDLT